MPSQPAAQAPQGFTYPALYTISGDSGMSPLAPTSTPTKEPANMATKTPTKTSETRPFTVELTILCRDLDAAVDATHDSILAACRRDGVPAIHEATRAKPSEPAAQDVEVDAAAGAAATIPEEPDSFEAVARDLWSGMAMGMSLGHFDTSKVHARLHNLAKAEKAGGKPSQPAKQGGAAKLALHTLGAAAVEYHEAQVAYRTSKAERTARMGYGAGASDEVLRAAVDADAKLGRMAVQYAENVLASQAAAKGA